MNLPSEHVWCRYVERFTTLAERRAVRRTFVAWTERFLAEELALPPFEVGEVRGVSLLRDPVLCMQVTKGWLTGAPDSTRL